MTSVICGACQTQLQFPFQHPRIKCGVCFSVLDAPPGHPLHQGATGQRGDEQPPPYSLEPETGKTLGTTDPSEEGVALQDVSPDTGLEGPGEAPDPLDKEEEAGKPEAAQPQVVAPLDSRTDSTNNPLVWALTSNFLCGILFSCCCLKSMRSNGIRFCLTEWWWRFVTLVFTLLIMFWTTFIGFPGQMQLTPVQSVSRWELLPQDSIARNEDMAVCMTSPSFYGDDGDRAQHPWCWRRYSYCAEGESCDHRYFNSWCDVAECEKAKRINRYVGEGCPKKDCNATYFDTEPRNGTSCPTTKHVAGCGYFGSDAGLTYNGWSGTYCPHEVSYGVCREKVLGTGWTVAAAVLALAATWGFSILRMHFIWTFRSRKRTTCSLCCCQVYRVLTIDAAIPALFLAAFVLALVARQDRLVTAAAGATCTTNDQGIRTCDKLETWESVQAITWLTFLWGVIIQFIGSMFHFCYRKNKLRSRVVSAAVVMSSRADALVPVASPAPPSYDDVMGGRGEQEAQAGQKATIPLSTIHSPFSPYKSGCLAFLLVVLSFGLGTVSLILTFSLV